MGAVLVLAFAQDGAPRLDVATDDNVGPHLVDGSGMTLYLFANDTEGQSNCTDACATNWPPMLATGDVALGDGVDPDLVGTAARADGTTQVTYDGMPLYTFVRDTEPGMIAGQGVNDVWFAVSPAGPGVRAAATLADGATAFATAMEEGAQVFSRICAACHGANGDESLASHVVILAGNARLASERLVLRRVINGSGYMPGFGAALSDREVAAVATYVRNSFGNLYGIVGEEDATATR